MKDFNRGGGSSDRRGGGGSGDRRGGSSSFGRRDGGRDFNRGGSDRPEMHKATCAECGSSCEVPFKPMSGKPVFCSNCFKSKEGGDRSDSRRSEGRDSGRSNSRDSFRDSFEEKKMFPATCAECGDACEVPFKPSAGKSVLCSTCFSKADTRSDDRKEDRRNSAPKAPSNEQFEMLNAKLDQILKALNSTTTVKPVAKKEVVKEEKIVEPKKVVKKAAAKKVVAEKKVVKKVAKKK